MNGYTNLELNDLTRDQQMIVDAVINEGKLRRNDEIMSYLNRQLTEAYGENNLAKIEIIEDLIKEIPYL